MVFLCLCIFCGPLVLHGQNAAEEISGITGHEKFAQYIELENLKNHVYAFASDSMMGREAGDIGGEMAGNYIENFFKEIGIPAVGDFSYRQTIGFSWLRWGEVDVRINGKSYNYRNDFLAMPKDNRSLEELQIEELIFCGYGIETEDYTDWPKGDFEGKVALVLSGEPVDADGNYALRGNKDPSEWSSNVSKKLHAAGERGFDLVILVERDIDQLYKENRRNLFRPVIASGQTEPKEGMPGLIYVSVPMAKSLLGDQDYIIDQWLKDEIELSTWEGDSQLQVEMEINLEKTVRTLEGDNILGYIEGVDPEMKDELVVLSAHYDHIGHAGGEVFYGANDNASGTSAVMEMGRAFVQAKREGVGPARSVLLLLLTAEEKGLLGSAFYVENPVFPLENTIANINIDMLGRTDEKHRELGISDYIYPIGSDRLSTEFHDIIQMTNQEFSGIKLDFTYNDPEDPNRYYFRSDHYNFARNGVPAVFYFNGMNEDYHLSSDTPEKMDFESMTAVSRHIFHVAWELANREDRIEVDVISEN